MVAKRVSNDQIAALWQLGWTIPRICQEIPCSDGTVRHALRSFREKAEPMTKEVAALMLREEIEAARREQSTAARYKLHDYRFIKPRPDLNPTDATDATDLRAQPTSPEAV